MRGTRQKYKDKLETRERLALRNKAKAEEHFRDLRGVKRRNRNDNVFARPDGRRANAETTISCRGPGLARKKKEVCQLSGGGGNNTDVHLWQRSRE